jgi:hypothetical protein
MESYHDDIQALAKKIEAERAKIYVVGSGTDANGKVLNAMAKRPSVVLTEAENLYIEAAHYKIVRAWHFTASRVKMLDDLLDAYNYIAMAFNEVNKNGKQDANEVMILDELRKQVAELKAVVVKYQELEKIESEAGTLDVTGI